MEELLNNKIEDVPLSSIDYTPDDVADLLKKKECCVSEIDYIRELIDGRNVLLNPTQSGISIVVKKEGKKLGYFIKIGEDLEKDSDLYEFFHKHGVAPDIENYITVNHDFLITELIDGNVASDIATNGSELIVLMAEYLRKFHDKDWSFKSLDASERDLLNNNIIDYCLNKDDLDEDIINYIESNKEIYNYKETMIHGSFTPHHLFIKSDGKYLTTSFRNAHLGDRHIDIAYTLYNIYKELDILDNEDLINEFRELFFDAYGRELIDYDRLNLCSIIVYSYFKLDNSLILKRI